MLRFEEGCLSEFIARADCFPSFVQGKLYAPFGRVPRNDAAFQAERVNDAIKRCGFSLENDTVNHKKIEAVSSNGLYSF
jgi:hypothetical protein